MTNKIATSATEGSSRLIDRLASVKRDARNLLAEIEQLSIETRLYRSMGEFGSSVAEVRKLKGISQEDLALLAGISISTLQKIESNRGNPTLKVMQNLGRALGIQLWMSV